MSLRFIFWIASLYILPIGCKKKNVERPEIEESERVVVGLVSYVPTFPYDDSEITLMFDAEKGNRALDGVSGDIYAHIGVLTDLSKDASDWRYVKTEWTDNSSANKLTKVSSDIYQLKLRPRQYFSVPSNEKITHLAMIFRNANGSLVGRNEDGSDLYIPIYEKNKLHVRFVLPEKHPTYVPTLVTQQWAVGQKIDLTSLASGKAEMVVTVNNQPLSSEETSMLNSSYTFPSTGLYTFKVSAKQNGQTVSDDFEVFVSGETEIADLPAGISSDGVTFLENGTSAVFVLTAPEKQSVSLIGDFNDWKLSPAGMMKKTTDGQKWWIRIDNLDPATAYAYQFIVDGNLRIADPYAELVLDPNNDLYIKSGTFPDLKSYPQGKTTGIVSVSRYEQNAYGWQHTVFDRPHKHDLVIYELHLRDFLQMNNYQTLTDTLDYLSGLGINALQLMPVNEFEGNSSWGYNPSFYFAPDKYYGTKNNLKRLIDECHGRGIAVIMDVVLNHSFGQSPMVQLYFENGKPANNSPWFNVDPMHPFNVGYDFNHESTFTRSFTKDVIKFWMEEYRVDGFRFDLSKGFTQKNSGTSDGAVGPWSAYDASRVAIWKDYNDFMRSIDQDFYVILEHFADDQEERELSGEGMMLWNNLSHAFNEATMGWLDQSNFNRLFHTERGFDQPNLISYMESHDEERIMYKNLEYGNSSGSYNIKELNTALKRVELAAAFLFAAPGPKMIWQFGELGYEVPIDYNGRTGEKPIRWEYNNGARRALYGSFSRFIHFKTHNEIFRNGQAQFDVSGAVKYVQLTHGSQEVLVVGNFDVVSRAASIPSFAGGIWYDNMQGEEISLSAGYGRELAPGEYHVYSKTRLNR